MATKRGMTIIIPVLNEAGNILPLVQRIFRSLETITVPFELVFIDDHSIDDTVTRIKKIDKKNIYVHAKKGERGKANSIIEGATYAHYDTLCMIDADLQYPPESIPLMYERMLSTNSDIIITNREVHDTSFLRRFVSSGFNLVFTKFLFGIDYDTQSGLKLFKADIFKHISISPSRWSFDLEFIVQSLLHGYTIATVDIHFAKRTEGDAKVSIVSTSYELAKASLQLRTRINKKTLMEKYISNKQRSTVANMEYAA